MSRSATIHTRLLAPDPAGLAEAAAALRAGRLVALPTETVYGLGADACNGEAVARIYAAKDRPRFNPLIAHVADRGSAEAEGTFDRHARALADAFWPGPLTLVVPAGPRCGISDLVRAGLPSVALRVPDHPVAQALLAAAGCPVAAPSANRSGRISPTDAQHVIADLDGRVDLVVDGGPSRVGLESTIVACLGDEPALLRPGGIARRAIEAILGRPLGAPGQAITAPGMLASHYAPRARLRLGARRADGAEAVLDFNGQLAGQGGDLYLDLSPRGDLAEAASRLFGFLRRLDREGGSIAVASIPAEGLGEAIADRLSRAAAPRDRDSALGGVPVNLL